VKKRLIVVVLCLLLLSIPILTVYAASSVGEAEVGDEIPTITNPAFTDVAITDKNNSAIDVATEYWASATIADNNTLVDLTIVYFTIWSSNSTASSADAEANHYTFSYTQATDTYAEVGPNAGGTDMVAANCSDPADQSARSGTFRLAFKLDKQGDHTHSTTGWSIRINVTDDGANTDSETQLFFGVNYYSEMTVDDATHGWTGLSPGDTDVLLTSPGDFDIDITVTSNDGFDVQAKGNGTLSSGSNTIALSAITIHKDTLGSAIALTTSYADVGGLTSQTAGEALAKSFKLWITVPNPQPSGTYEYILSVQVIED